MLHGLCVQNGLTRFMPTVYRMVWHSFMTTVSESSDKLHDDFVGQTVKRLWQERPKSIELCVDVGARWGEVEGWGMVGGARNYRCTVAAAAIVLHSDRPWRHLQLSERGCLISADGTVHQLPMHCGCSMLCHCQSYARSTPGPAWEIELYL